LLISSPNRISLEDVSLNFYVRAREAFAGRFIPAVVLLIFGYEKPLVLWGCCLFTVEKGSF
jgi:hypothetical protein